MATASSHTMRALAELRQRILSGQLQGGERLLEVPLAEMLQISRTPVREAMSRLAEEGLLQRGPSGGFIVRSFGIEDAIDAIELRGVLEGTAARLAAERGVSPEALAEMSSIVEDIDASFSADGREIDFERYSEHNARFHECLSRLAGSQIISDELERVTRLPFASPSAFMPVKADIENSRDALYVAQAQHREMVAAIAGREGARAEALAREHARIAQRDLDNVIKREKAVNGTHSGLALIVDELSG